MKPTMNNALFEVSDNMDYFVKNLPGLEEADLIDLAARLKPIAKACKAIDEQVKEMVKKKLKHSDGERFGVMFKAVLKLIDTTRFQTSLFKEEQPVMYGKYAKTDTDERVSFEIR